MWWWEGWVTCGHDWILSRCLFHLVFSSLSFSRRAPEAMSPLRTLPSLIHLSLYNSSPISNSFHTIHSLKLLLFSLLLLQIAPSNSPLLILSLAGVWEAKKLCLDPPFSSLVSPSLSHFSPFQIWFERSFSHLYWRQHGQRRRWESLSRERL